MNAYKEENENEKWLAHKEGEKGYNQQNDKDGDFGGKWYKGHFRVRKHKTWIVFAL